jgi:hypothetical protein
MPARWAGALAAGCALAAAGCGGGHHDAPPPVRQAPVASQVREALAGALGSPALTGLFPTHDPQLPWRAVGICHGPGGPGTYRCATTPRGSHGVRTVTVTVKRGGQWTTRALPVATTWHGRRLSARTAVWGVGIRVPRER